MERNAQFQNGMNLLSGTISQESRAQSIMAIDQVLQCLAQRIQGHRASQVDRDNLVESTGRLDALLRRKPQFHLGLAQRQRENSRPFQVV